MSASPKGSRRGGASDAAPPRARAGRADLGRPLLCCVTGPGVLLDLFLELEEAVHEGLRTGWAAGHVDIDGDEVIDAHDDGVGAVVGPAVRGAASHGDHPLGIGASARRGA